MLLSRVDTPGLRYPLDPFALDPSKFTAPISRLLVDPHHRTSYSEQWSFDYQREVTRDLSFTVGYAGNRGMVARNADLADRVVHQRLSLCCVFSSASPSPAIVK